MMLGQMGRCMTAAAAPILRLSKSPLALVVALLILLPGCIHQPVLLAPNKQVPIDRKLVEYPAGFQLVPLVNDLNCPTAIAIDDDGNLLVVESGGGTGSEPHIFG